MVEARMVKWEIEMNEDFFFWQTHRIVCDTRYLERVVFVDNFDT